MSSRPHPRDAVVLSRISQTCLWRVPGTQPSTHPDSLTCRNILSLINAFDFPDQSISRDDYAAVLAHLNVTQPERVAGLGLESCHLEDFLDKVAGGLATGQWGHAGPKPAADGWLGEQVSWVGIPGMGPERGSQGQAVAKVRQLPAGPAVTRGPGAAGWDRQTGGRSPGQGLRGA